MSQTSSKNTAAEDDSKIESMSFEQLLVELNKIINQLEKGDIELDKAIALFEKGNLLRKSCEEIISNAKLKVDKIINEGKDVVGEEEFSSESYMN